MYIKTVGIASANCLPTFEKVPVSITITNHSKQNKPKRKPQKRGKSNMKAIIIGILSLLPLTMMGANSSKEKGIPLSNIQYFNGDATHEIKLDYNLTTAKEKSRKLAAAKSCKKYLTNQLLVENEKYDRLTIEKNSLNRRKAGRKIKSEISKQLKVTMELLSKTEAISDYINWLSS